MAIGTLGEAITPKEIASYWEANVESRKPYLGETLFPAKKQLGLDLKWIKGAGGMAVALKPSAFDSETRLRDRIGFQELATEMPFFKEGTLVKEKERQELNKVIASGNQGYIDIILGKIYDDITGLVDGAKVQAERMMMQLLSSGGINISANGLDYVYDYQFDPNHMETLAGGFEWSGLGIGAGAPDIINDIETWMDIVEDDTGTRPTRAICSRKTFGYIKNDLGVLSVVNPLGGIVVTDAVIKEFLKNALGLTVQVYNKQFTTEVGGAGQPFFPDDVFTLIPEGGLGNLYYGTTPEESDLLGGSQVDVAIVDTGVAITTEKRVDPVNVFTKVSAIMLPSFEQIDKVFIANVA